MSSPSEPEEIVSISIERSFLPSFITEPLPNCRSIWESAADSAFDLSMEEPSTIRRAGTDIWWLLMTDSGGTDSGESRTFGCGIYVLHLFSVRNMFFLRQAALPPRFPARPEQNVKNPPPWNEYRRTHLMQRHTKRGAYMSKPPDGNEA